MYANMLNVAIYSHNGYGFTTDYIPYIFSPIELGEDIVSLAGENGHYFEVVDVPADVEEVELSTEEVLDSPMWVHFPNKWYRVSPADAIQLASKNNKPAAWRAMQAKGLTNILMSTYR
jgi:hypothetical protein